MGAAAVGLGSYLGGGKTENKYKSLQDKTKTKTIEIPLRDLLKDKINDDYALPNIKEAYNQMVASLNRVAAEKKHVITKKNSPPQYVIHLGSDSYCDSQNIPNDGLEAEVFYDSGPVSGVDFMLRCLYISGNYQEVWNTDLDRITIFKLSEDTNHEFVEKDQEPKHLVIHKDMIDKKQVSPVLCITIIDDNEIAV